MLNSTSNRRLFLLIFSQSTRVVILVMSQKRFRNCFDIASKLVSCQDVKERLSFERRCKTTTAKLRSTNFRGSIFRFFENIILHEFQGVMVSRCHGVKLISEVSKSSLYNKYIYIYI